MSRMYSERVGNVSVFRGCGFFCIYCAFRTSLSRSHCEGCRTFEPHAHIEVLKRKPPKTRDGKFLTVGLTGDISFMNKDDFQRVIEYCQRWKDRTFLIQSKNPGYFLPFAHRITSNVIIGTTIETNRLITDISFGTTTCFYDRGDNDHGFDPISQAPSSRLRCEAMILYNGRKAVTIEPILDFDIAVMSSWITDKIKPEFVWIGYDSRPEKNRLPEPTLVKTQELINHLEDAGVLVHQKLIRKAWYEMDV